VRSWPKAGAEGLVAAEVQRRDDRWFLVLAAFVPFLFIGLDNRAVKFVAVNLRRLVAAMPLFLERLARDPGLGLAVLARDLLELVLQVRG